MICRRYKLPSRKTISTSLLPQSYNKCREIIIRTAICIPTDAWTSINNASFAAFTAHWINDKAEMQSCLLQCVDINEKHNAENLTQFLQRNLKRITPLILLPPLAMTIGSTEDAWHTINLVAQRGLKEIDRTLSKARRIVGIL